MLELMKSWLYDWFTWSGLMLHVVTLLEPLALKFDFLHKDGCNYKVKDEGGATMKITKYKGKLFPPFGTDKLEGIASLPIRKDDVMLVGYPKTGCHWVYEIMRMLVNGKVGLSKHGKELGGMIDAMPRVILDSVPSPRVLNTHLYYDELPTQVREKKTKMVVTVRSPKDTVVSYYNHHTNMHKFYQYDGSFDNFFKLFMTGELGYGSYFDYISAWEEAAKSQNNNPILVVEYEKLKQDPIAVVKTIAKFLQISVTDEFVSQVLHECNFKKMKEKRTGKFTEKMFRKGQVGDWRNWLTEAQSTQMDQFWKERMHKCTYQPQM